MSYTRKSLLDAAMKCHVENRGWDAHSLLGWYVYQYEERYKRSWRLSASLNEKHFSKDIQTLIDRYGIDDTKRAIEVIFKEKALRWVRMDCLQFLCSELSFHKHIVPFLEPEKVGEQSEWRDPRGEKGTDTVKFGDYTRWRNTGT